MKITASNSVSEKELPLQLNISFQKVFVLFKKYTNKEFAHHPYHGAAKQMLRIFENYPELINGFSDVSLLKKYENQINLVLDPVLTPIKQEYYSKFRLLIMRLNFSLKLSVYPGSIFPLV
jgi:hypothetical protein